MRQAITRTAFLLVMLAIASMLQAEVGGVDVDLIHSFTIPNMPASVDTAARDTAARDTAVHVPCREAGRSANDDDSEIRLMTYDSITAPRPILAESCEPKPFNLAWQKGEWRIEPFGFLAGEMVGSTAPTTSRPFVLYVAEDVGESETQFTIHGQTTALGFDIHGPRVCSFQTGGKIFFNFLGDRPVLNQSTPFLLQAYGELKNEYWRLGFGVAPDLFGPMTPRTVNFGGHIQAGNIAAFRGQFRVDRFFQVSEQARWTTMVALSQQVVADFAANPASLGTDNGWPNIEGQILYAIGKPTFAGQAPIQFNVSGVIGETRALGLAGKNVSQAWGISTGGQIANDHFGVRGEVFAGQAIGTYNAAIGQSLNPENGEPIQTVGGFGELWFKPCRCVSWHVGYGIDDPRNEDLGRIVDPTLGPIAGQLARNSVYWTSIFWDVTRYFEVGLELSYRETSYIAPSVSNEATLLHFRSRLIF